MSSLAHCLEVHKFHGIDADKLKTAAAAYRSEGFKAQESNESAVKDAIKLLEAERSGIISQVKKQLKKQPHEKPEKKVTIEKEPVAESIGKNTAEQPVYADEGGRYLVSVSGAKHYPREDGKVASLTVQELYDKDRHSFLTAEEITAFDEKGITAPKPAAEMTTGEMLAEWDKQAKEPEASTVKEKAKEAEAHPSKAADALKKAKTERPVKEQEKAREELAKAKRQAKAVSITGRVAEQQDRRLPSGVRDEKIAETKPGFIKRETAAAPGASNASDLQSEINKITSHWKNAPDVKVVQSQSELPDIILGYSEGGIIDGVYYKGTVYIVADNQTSPEAAVMTLLHESFGHYGMRKLLGEDFGNIMQDVYDSKKAEVVKIAEEYGYDIKTAKGRVLAADEWLAREVINNPDSGWARRVIAAIKRFIRRIAPSLAPRLSDTEIRQLLESARTYVEKGRPTTESLTGYSGKPGYQKTEIADRFYSQAIKTVEDKMPNKMQASAVLPWLRKQPGIKKAELEWMNVEELLEGKKVVTKDEVVDLLRENQVVIEEVLKSSQPYIELQLPGKKENYRVFLFRLPVITTEDTLEIKKLRKQYEKLTEEKRKIDLRVDYDHPEKWVAKDRANVKKSNGISSEKASIHNKILLFEEGASRERFSTSHWDEANVFAHIRTNERTDAEGNKILFIEEIQSDQANALRRGEKVPDFPFKTNWQEVALKRIIRMASEQGFDKISWMTGQQTADRYDLSKQVEEIEYDKRTQHLRVVSKEGKIIIDEATPQNKLESIVGKEVAAKIEKGDNFVWLQGLDLKIGADWAYALYDRMIPQYLKKFGKKYGAEVGTTEINGETQASFTITPKLKRAALVEGMPLFQKRKPLKSEIDTTGFLPTEVEKRMAKAKGGPKATFKEKAKETLAEAKRQKAHFPDLQTIEDKTLRAKFNDILRRHQEVPEAAKNETIRLIHSFTENLSKDGYKVYRMNIILADMMRDIKNGLTYDGKLPFGFKTAEEVRESFSKFQDVAARNPEIKEALKKRSDAINKTKNDLVKAKLLKKEVLKDDDYFHHQVIQYWEKKYGMATGSKDVRTHWRPWMAARKGSPLDYNTDYVEAEYTAMSQQLAQLGVVETLKRIKKEGDIYVSLKKEARSQNVKNLWELLRGRGELKIHPKTKEEVDPLLPWKQKIAISNANLAKMALDKTLEYDSEWQEIVDKLASSAKDKESLGVDDLRWFNFLSYLINTNKAGANWAATVFKAIRDRDSYIEETLGKQFLTYNKIIPKGYVEWKPDPNKGWFWANVITDKILEKMQRGELDPKDVEARKLLAKGRDIIWVIPEGLAKTMDGFKGTPDPTWVGNVADSAMRAWKQYILLNPYSVMRYNLNNMSGDLDAAIAYAPEIATKYAWKAFRDLRKWHKRKKLDPATQKEIDFAQASGAIQSGFSMQEVDDVYSALNTDKIVRDVFLDENPNWFTMSGLFGLKRAGTRYWAFVRRITALRENTLRLAAYRFFEANKDKRLYGASNPTEVDAITDHREASAKKARELMGDYGNISKSGEYIRKRLMPFYCVPSEAEILTRDGWKTYSQLVDKEEVLTYNMGTRQTEWQELQDYAVFDFDDKLITLSNKYGFKFQFTGEHRVPVLEQYKDKLKVVQAKDLKSHHKIPVVAPHKFEDESLLSAQDAAVLGWIVTDGYCRRRGNSFESMIYQSPKNYAQEIREAFSEYISSESVHPDTGVICFRLKADKTREIAKVFTSYDALPAIVTRLDKEACCAMREAMMMGDGHDAERKGQSFTQKRQSAIDAFQILCYQLGEAFNVRPVKKYDSIIHGGYIKQRDRISVNKWDRTLEPYSGKVWCPRTPNSTWIMRQNGKVMITGNSWMEINTPRYVYMMRNTKYENRDVDSVKKQMVAVAGKKLVLVSGKMAMRASMLMGAVMLWNMMVFPDEEEELGETGRRQLHIILGRREDGSIITLRFQGALSDALSFFGLEDWPADMKDVLKGKRTVVDKLKEVPLALLNRGVQAIRPEPKMLGEIISGKSFYPDVTRPLPIRDRVEHVLRTFKLDRVYREALERPGRGKTPGASRTQQVVEHFASDLKSLLVYESDPGLLAYYDTRQMVNDWLAKIGDEKYYGGTPTKKGNAFYYYKQAMKYGDLAAAEKYLKKYYALGGTYKSRLRSIKYAHPLSSISGMKKIAFQRSLSPKQQDVFKRALMWYKKTYY